MQALILAAGIFVILITVMELIRYAFRYIKNPDRKKIKRKLQLMSYNSNNGDNTIIRNQVLSTNPTLNKILTKIPFITTLNRIKNQANALKFLGFYCVISVFIAAAGFILLSVMTLNLMIAIIGAPIMAVLPWLYLRLKGKQRLKKFQQQLPEAMELIARSLKAGHAFYSALKLAADQMEDPIGTEFTATIQEINFGISTVDALHNLTKRVDCPDLDLFVISIILQRETGGDLAEIMESNAHIIRERFKFFRHVKSLTADGRYSAIILFLIPLLLFLLLYSSNPEYMSVLFTDSFGITLLMLAGTLLFIGFIVIRKMLNLKV